MLVTSAITAALLCGWFLIWLTGAGYSRAMAVLLAAVVLAQAGPLMATVTGQSLWLALGVSAVVASAQAFAGRADARRIILFGGSLAAIQLLDPLGGAVAAGLLPAILMIGRGHVERRQMAGLYALLMFMPLMMAISLLYLIRVHHFDPAGLLTDSSPGISAHVIAAHAGLLWRLAPAVAVSVVVSPALSGLDRLRQAPARAIALVALGVVASGAAGAFLGAIRKPVPLLAAVAPIVVAALAQWPASPTRIRDAVAVALLCTALSWAAVFALSPQVFAGG